MGKSLNLRNPKAVIYACSDALFAAEPFLLVGPLLTAEPLLCVGPLFAAEP